VIPEINASRSIIMIDTWREGRGEVHIAIIRPIAGNVIVAEILILQNSTKPHPLPPRYCYQYETCSSTLL
jgi:hypothetical protein